MNDTATDLCNDSYPSVTWTWHDGRGGLLSTQIVCGGQIRQLRQHDPSDVVTSQDLGAIPSAKAATLLAQCRDALVSGGPSNAALAQPTFGEEMYQLVLADSADTQYSRQVSRLALRADAGLEAIRREVLGARRRVQRRWNLWSSAGARWCYLTLLITCLLGLCMIYDRDDDNAFQARVQQRTGTVTEHAGVPYQCEFLTVQLDGGKLAPEVRIFKHLSHPNWEAAGLGSRVAVAYDGENEQAWLAADLARWQHDKQMAWRVSGLLLAMVFMGLVWLRSYQIGYYEDGEEYMIYEDRVVTDDSDALRLHSTLLWFRMFV